MFLILLIILFFSIYIIINKKSPEKNEKECDTKEDCVPAGCCHPDSCVLKDKSPDCSRIFCTQICSGPLDCGVGYCGCVNNKCLVIKS